MDFAAEQFLFRTRRLTAGSSQCVSATLFNLTLDVNAFTLTVTMISVLQA